MEHLNDCLTLDRSTQADWSKHTGQLHSLKMDVLANQILYFRGNSVKPVNLNNKRSRKTTGDPPCLPYPPNNPYRVSSGYEDHISVPMCQSCVLLPDLISELGIFHPSRVTGLTSGVTVVEK